MFTLVIHDSGGEAMKRFFTFVLVLVLTIITLFTCIGCTSINTPVCQHTAQIGTCQNCNVFQNQSDYNSIKNKLSEASNLIEIVLRSMPSTSNINGDYNQKLFNSLKSSQPQVENAKTCLNDAIQLCNNYSELSTITSSLLRAQSALPTTINSSNSDDLQQYLSGLRTFIVETTSARTQLLYIK